MYVICLMWQQQRCQQITDAYQTSPMCAHSGELLMLQQCWKTKGRFIQPAVSCASNNAGKIKMVKTKYKIHVIEKKMQMYGAFFYTDELKAKGHINNEA
jgi:hypothetical protein